MIDSQVAAFTFVAAILTITPGADTMLVVRNALQGGRHSGIVTTFGICAGLFIHAALSALGLSVVLMHSATAFHLVKLAGACYLAWLGLQSLYSAACINAPLADTAPRGTREAGSPRHYFREGFLCNVLNPKVAVFYLAFLPQFIGKGDPVLSKSILLAGIHFIEGIAWLSMVSLIVDQTRRVFLKPSMHRWLNGVCGTLLIGFGIRLALERR